MKRTAVLLILIMSIMSMSCFAETLQLGDCFTLGEYNEEPILWRYMADDEHGKLIVSDKIICRKPFGIDNYWRNSYIRKWLNSVSAEGAIDWSLYVPRWIIPEIDISEKGFLNDGNFTYTEKCIIKVTKQWTMLPEKYLDLSENENSQAYSAIFGKLPGSPRDGGKIMYYSIDEVPEIYHGAAHKVTDAMFLLDETQIYGVWRNFDDIRALYDNDTYNSSIEYTDGYYSYYLRTPSEEGITCITEFNKYEKGFSLDGIRPAFYIDEENSYIKSGSGTEDDPYVMDGKEKTVYINNVKTETENPPVTYEGIVMVPMQETFEKLGANVVYNEETQAVTAELNGKYIYTLSDNKGILINGESGDMGYPMTMIMGMPYVPLSAIELSVTPNVLWDNELQQLNIVL